MTITDIIIHLIKKKVNYYGELYLKIPSNEYPAFPVDFLEFEELSKTLENQSRKDRLLIAIEVFNYFEKNDYYKIFYRFNDEENKVTIVRADGRNNIPVRTSCSCRDGWDAYFN